MSGHILAQTPHSSAHSTSFASLLLEKQSIAPDSSLLQARMLEWIIHTSVKFEAFDCRIEGGKKKAPKGPVRKWGIVFQDIWDFPCVPPWVSPSQLSHWAWWLSWWCAPGYFSSELVIEKLAFLFPGNITVFKEYEILWQEYNYLLNV